MKSYETRRLLTSQLETDVLTGLNNRRKLFETMVALVTTNAEKIRPAVEKVKMGELNPTISIGVAYSGNREVQNYENVIGQADKAAYKAKHLGRNKVYLSQYDPDLSAAPQVRHSH